MTKRIITGIILIVISILLVFPHIDYQGFISNNMLEGALSTGDHGRDLYAFNAVLHGQKPYIDFWWVYGPLMPYYFAIFLKLLGINILSVLFARFILLLVILIAVYLILSSFISLPYAFLGTLWYLVFMQEFFHTYTYAGAILCMLLALFFMAEYLRKQKTKYQVAALICSFLLLLIKLNFGITLLFVLLGLNLYIDLVLLRKPSQKILIFISYTLLIVVVSFVIYFLLLSPLNLNEIRQCLPYLQSDHPYNNSLGYTLQRLSGAFINNIKTSPGTLAILCLAFTCFIITLRREIKTCRAEKKINTTVLFLLFVIILGLLNLQEFLVSGVYYRTFWSKPFFIILMFLAIGLGLRKAPRPVNIIIYLSLSAFLILNLHARYAALKQVKTPAHYFSLNKGKIFVSNASGWINTVSATTMFLEENLAPSEKFFALPYDPLYYFLAGKLSPTRQLIFFEHINITPKQEKKIIADLEKEKVNWIVMSNRIVSSEKGLGIFGKNYCPLIEKYVKNNFEAVKQYGAWNKQGGWGWDHGTIILKRKK